MQKLARTGWGFAKQGAKLLRHYGTKEVSHPEFISGSIGAEMLKQVQHDNPCVIASVAKQSQHGLTLNRLLRRFTPRNDERVGKRSFAFTLSEVLIVLAVLGIVAAVTIPDLIQDYREKALITALKKNYTVFSQAVDMAIAENGPMDGWDIGKNWTQDGALKLYNILKPYLKIEETCGNSNGCFADNYEALFNKNFVYSDIAKIPNFAKGVLASGASFHVLSAGTGCQDNYCGYMGVDVNGKAGPNKAGVDYFYFEFTNDNGLTPGGAHSSVYCKYNDSDTANGWFCTWWVLKHENMDYLRKAGKYTKY